MKFKVEGRALVKEHFDREKETWRSGCSYRPGFISHKKEGCLSVISVDQLGFRKQW